MLTKTRSWRFNFHEVSCKIETPQVAKTLNDMQEVLVSGASGFSGFVRNKKSFAGGHRLLAMRQSKEMNDLSFVLQPEISLTI